MNCYPHRHHRRDHDRDHRLHHVFHRNPDPYAHHRRVGTPLEYRRHFDHRCDDLAHREDPGQLVWFTVHQPGHHPAAHTQQHPHISAQASDRARRALPVFVTTLTAATLLHLAGMHQQAGVTHPGMMVTTVFPLHPIITTVFAQRRSNHGQRWTRASISVDTGVLAHMVLMLAGAVITIRWYGYQVGLLRRNQRSSPGNFRGRHTGVVHGVRA